MMLKVVSAASVLVGISEEMSESNKRDRLETEPHQVLGGGNEERRRPRPYRRPTAINK